MLEGGFRWHALQVCALVRLKEYLYQYASPNCSTCDLCQYRTESVRHYLLFCPAFAAQRQQMLEDVVRDRHSRKNPTLPNLTI